MPIPKDLVLFWDAIYIWGTQSINHNEKGVQFQKIARGIPVRDSIPWPAVERSATAGQNPPENSSWREGGTIRIPPSLRDEMRKARVVFRWYRFAQPPANGFHPCRGVFVLWSMHHRYTTLLLQTSIGKCKAHFHRLRGRQSLMSGCSEILLKQGLTQASEARRVCPCFSKISSFTGESQSS